MSDYKTFSLQIPPYSFLQMSCWTLCARGYRMVKNSFVSCLTRSIKYVEIRYSFSIWCVKSFFVPESFFLCLFNRFCADVVRLAWKLTLLLTFIRIRDILSIKNVFPRFGKNLRCAAYHMTFLKVSTPLLWLYEGSVMPDMMELVKYVYSIRSAHKSIQPRMVQSEGSAIIESKY